MSDGVIVLTCAGRSERYPSYTYGKWAITHPSGNLMGAEALRCMEHERWDIVVAVNDADTAQFSLPSIKAEFVRALRRPVQVVNVGTTENRLETVKQALYLTGYEHSDAPVCVRDCDNWLAFSMPSDGIDAVVVADMLQSRMLDPSTRAYADVQDGVIVSLDEKQTVHRHFVAGAYFFAQARLLLDAITLETDAQHMTEIMARIAYLPKAIYADEYEDWGTERDWERYKRTFRTLFVDIDGTLFESAHRTFGEKPQGQNRAIKRNTEFLRLLHKTGRYHIILTTSRGRELAEATGQQLRAHRVPYDNLVMGLPVCGRVLVNDYDPKRGESTADAVTVVRGASDLEEEFRRAGLL